MFYIFFSRLSQLLTAVICSYPACYVLGRKQRMAATKVTCSIQILIILIIDFSKVSLPYTLWLYNILDTETVQWSVLMFDV